MDSWILIAFSGLSGAKGCRFVLVGSAWVFLLADWVLLLFRALAWFHISMCWGVYWGLWRDKDQISAELCLVLKGPDGQI